MQSHGKQALKTKIEQVIDLFTRSVETYPAVMTDPVELQLTAVTPSNAALASSSPSSRATDPPVPFLPLLPVPLLVLLFPLLPTLSFLCEKSYVSA